jgi:phosphatidylglycerol:prolipoprotein diacylglycerol transferase
VDGFLVVAPIVAAIALVVTDLPVGRTIDAVAPGLFLAVALGRIGCLLAGCCAGRCTASRWALWSSDRRVGARRVPAQLIEAAAGAVLAVVGAWFVLNVDPPVHGGVFIVSLGVYAVIRQVVLRLRAERRVWAASYSLTAGATALAVLLVAVAAHLQTLAVPSFG